MVKIRFLKSFANVLLHANRKAGVSFDISVLKFYLANLSNQLTVPKTALTRAKKEESGVRNRMLA